MRRGPRGDELLNLLWGRGEGFDRVGILRLRIERAVTRYGDHSAERELAGFGNGAMLREEMMVVPRRLHVLERIVSADFDQCQDPAIVAGS